NLNDINSAHYAQRPTNSNLAARIASYELAFNMQKHAPEAVDFNQESDATRDLYGYRLRSWERKSGDGVCADLHGRAQHHDHRPDHQHADAVVRGRVGLEQHHHGWPWRSAV
ncbi:MAG TPA: DUF1501 domain-containing protein, partial [Planctomycetes bacterium]|nr:DUF1501 domain-containing protein [Planctomycetota bacterium]